MAGVDHKSHDMGLHAEQLKGRTQQQFFSATEEENFTYPWAFEVDFDKAAEFDALEMETTDINLKIRALMEQGHGTIASDSVESAAGIERESREPRSRVSDRHSVAGRQIDGYQPAIGWETLRESD